MSLPVGQLASIFLPELTVSVFTTAISLCTVKARSLEDHYIQAVIVILLARELLYLHDNLACRAIKNSFPCYDVASSTFHANKVYCCLALYNYNEMTIYHFYFFYLTKIIPGLCKKEYLL